MNFYVIASQCMPVSVYVVLITRSFQYTPFPVQSCGFHWRITYLPTVWRRTPLFFVTILATLCVKELNKPHRIRCRGRTTSSERIYRRLRTDPTGRRPTWTRRTKWWRRRSPPGRTSQVWDWTATGRRTVRRCHICILPRLPAPARRNLQISPVTPVGIQVGCIYILHLRLFNGLFLQDNLGRPAPER